MLISKPEGLTLFEFLKRTNAAQTHFIALAGAAVGFFFLFHFAKAPFTWIEVVGCLLFGLGAMAVFGSSALYHFLTDGFVVAPRLSHWLRNIDHFAIYLFIAASYTAVLIKVETGPWREILTIVIWTLAIAGILYTAVKHKLPAWAQHRLVYTAGFVAMGWTILPRITELFHRLSVTENWFLVGAGASYLIGAVIYASKKPVLIKDFFGFHELWHLFVMAGYTFQYLLVFRLYCA